MDQDRYSHNTPPQYGHRQPGSAQSSGSSARVVSLTDASTASASSMVPTPPYAASHLSRASLSSHHSGGSGSGNSGDRPLGRTYSSRPFQRHVSAPIDRNRLSGENSKDNDDVSVMIFSARG
jgi:serine/threonine-protein kinase TTK/MPS1